MSDRAPTPGQEFLRHTLATLAYRGRKALLAAPESFATFSAGGSTRPAGAILAHIGDLLDWALSMANGAEVWRDSTVASWDDGVQRFFEAAARLDARLTADAPLAVPAEKLFQGPVADALTHVGQIALLRRLADAPVRGESYFRAEIVSGRVGREQAAPRREFD
jgi:hypothetical protein